MAGKSGKSRLTKKLRRFAGILYGIFLAGALVSLVMGLGAIWGGAPTRLFGGLYSGLLVSGISGLALSATRALAGTLADTEEREEVTS